MAMLLLLLLMLLMMMLMMTMMLLQMMTLIHCILFLWLTAQVDPYYWIAHRWN